MSKENYIIDRIEELCAVHHMSRYALAQKSGISQASISTMLNRKTVPTVQTLEKLCGAFNITLAQFFAKGEKMPELTEEQEQVLELWMQMNEHEKERVLAYMQGIVCK